MTKLLVLNGPNLNLLGQREPEIYGSMTLADIDVRLGELASASNVELVSLQSNAEHELIEAVHAAAATFFREGAKLSFGDLYTLPNGQICGQMDAPETPLLPAGPRYLMTIAEPVRIGEEYSAVVVLDENGMVEMHCTTGLIHTDARTPEG